MARVTKNNVVMEGLTGHVGNVTFYQRNGQTIMRESGNGGKNPRTPLQQQQRLRFASLGSLWLKLRPWFGGMFIKDKASQTDYNMFTKLNQGKGVYFTKSEKEHGNVISLPVMISNGVLPEIKGTIENGCLVSNLDLRNLQIDENTTIGNLSEAMLYQGFDYYDELIFVACYQKEWQQSETVIKYDVECTMEICPIIFQDKRLLYQMVNPDFFKTVNGCLGTSALPRGCYGYLHRQKIDNNRNKLSPLTLANNNEELIQHFSTAKQFYLAGNSYGQMAERFLDPRNPFKMEDLR